MPSLVVPPAALSLDVGCVDVGVPLPFVRDSLAALGALPPVLECTFTSPPDLPAGYALPPTHLLALTFPPAPSPSSGAEHDGSDEAQRVLVPVHALPWALASPVLAHLLYPPPSPPPPPHAAPGAPLTPPSSPPLGARPSPRRTAPAPPAPAPTLSLPVIPLALPSLTGFTLLHASLHSSRPSHALRPLSRLPPSERLRALEGAWKVSCALGVGGAEASEWEGEMARGWGAAVRELEEGEEARRAGWGRA
ncbi:hypothetical protein JCM10450v2_008133 [Rhodotorula kratochvilovae]